MKISAFTFATLAGFATAKDDFHLRSAATDGVVQSTKSVDTTVFVKGLATADVSEDDLKIIHESVVVAFNSIYGPTTGTLIASANDDEETNLGECGGWGCGGYDHNNPQHRRSRWWGFSGDWWACGWICPDDDAMLGKEADADAVLVMNRVKVVQSGSAAATLPARHLVHTKFEETICQALRTSGASNLAHAKECAFSFVETPGEAFGSLPVEVSCTSGKPMGATFLVSGMPDDEAVTEADAILVNKSIKDAWNEVFFGAFGSGMATMTAEPFVGSAGDSMIFSGQFEPLCPNDGTPPSAAQHAKFEKVICDKLVASGSPSWENAKNCGFRTVARLE